MAHHPAASDPLADSQNGHPAPPLMAALEPELSDAVGAELAADLIALAAGRPTSDWEAEIERAFEAGLDAGRADSLDAYRSAPLTLVFEPELEDVELSDAHRAELDDAYAAARRSLLERLFRELHR
jgi:hypothetical protein